jgi:AraC-like DNA-binding protein
MNDFIRLRSVSQLHQMLGQEKPAHPLVTILDYAKVVHDPSYFEVKILLDFYLISMKTPAPTSLQYGRQYYDFEEGTMMFMAPEQVFTLHDFDEGKQYEGWGLFFHPDLIVGTALGKKIKDFSFFAYAVHEALHVSEVEKVILSSILDHIRMEYTARLDQHSHTVMVTAIEQLLNYAQRFYDRQFITRQKQNLDLVARFEQLLHQYFSQGLTLEQGLPRVEYFAEQLHLSADYLSDVLKKETGKSAKEYLHTEIIARAKHQLLNTSHTVNEIAYHLGFEYPQYFNRLFKAKVGMTPVAFRQVK